ncbi:MAG: hypothetical protein WBW49_15505 [Candidatus Acidiferrum sp.]
MFTFQQIPTVIRIAKQRTVLVLWDGKVNQELLTFDEAGFKLLYKSLSDNNSLQDDVTRSNIKQFLNDFLVVNKYDFNERGPIHFDEPKVKALLGIK